MTGFNYRMIPGVKEFEKGVREVTGAYKSIKGIGDYLDKNSDAIVERMGRIMGMALYDLWDNMKNSIGISPTILDPVEKYAFGKGNGKTQAGASPSVQKPAPHQPKPAAAPAPQQPKTSATPAGQACAKPAATPSPATGAQSTSSALDDLVNDFKNKLRHFNTGYDANIDVYDHGSVIKNYSPLASKPNISAAGSQVKPDSLDQRLIADQKYLEDSRSIARWYNQSYKTSWIINEAAKRGYEGIRNRTDITDRVALSIDSGFAYTRGKYDNTIATKLGAKEQLINDYLAGKSYKEIKENLKSKTNGMAISDSSILRVMHQYEKKQGKKVVGKRNGNGNHKNGQGNKGSKKK